MEALPQPPLVLIPPQQLLSVLMKAFDWVPAMHVLNHRLQRCRGWEIAPVIAAITIRLRHWSFTDQPPDAPLALAGLAPRPHGVELGHQPAAAAFAPADGAPAPVCPCGQNRIDALQLALSSPRDPDAEIRPDRHDVSLVTRLQAIKEVGVVTIVGVGCHTGVWNTPLACLVQQDQ